MTSAPPRLAAVLVAAGASRRMGTDKLWLDLFGRPVWRWAFDLLLTAVPASSVVVVVPEGSEDRFRLGMPSGAESVTVTVGGERRADSVRAGLAALVATGHPSDSVLLVHDAARPAADRALLERLLAAATTARAAIPTVPMTDTVKTLDGDRVAATLDRTALAIAQTPQLARLGDLAAALDGAPVTLTDDAAALELAGIPVTAIPGDAENRKLTDARDLPIIRASLAARATPLARPSVEAAERAAIGFDAHRLATGTPLRLGGLDFADEPHGLVGHSDGDAALHSVIDALLGAAGLGDIGTVFPADAVAAGTDSRDLLRQAVDQVTRAGWAVRRIDLAIVATRPVISPRRAEIAGVIGSLVGVQPDAVSVRGTTSDGLGLAGDEGIAAWALAVIGPR